MLRCFASIIEFLEKFARYINRYENKAREIHEVFSMLAVLRNIKARKQG
jgi:hypothetical protein